MLSTKLYIPPVRPELVSRPRLIERLNASLSQNQGFGRKLTLISAPAGFGKTTLLSEWINQYRLFELVWGNTKSSIILAQALAKGNISEKPEKSNSTNGSDEHGKNNIR